MAQTYTHPKCEKAIIQRGNKTGHCVKCCETFEGIDMFDAHQSWDDETQVTVCADPASMKYKKMPLELRDGSWWQTFTPEQLAQSKAHWDSLKSL